MRPRPYDPAEFAPQDSLFNRGNLNGKFSNWQDVGGVTEDLKNQATKFVTFPGKKTVAKGIEDFNAWKKTASPEEVAAMRRLLKSQQQATNYNATYSQKQREFIDTVLKQEEPAKPAPTAPKSGTEQTTTATEQPPEPAPTTRPEQAPEAEPEQTTTAEAAPEPAPTPAQPPRDTAAVAREQIGLLKQTGLDSSKLESALAKYENSAKTEADRRELEDSLPASSTVTREDLEEVSRIASKPLSDLVSSGVDEAQARDIVGMTVRQALNTEKAFGIPAAETLNRLRFENGRQSEGTTLNQQGGNTGTPLAGRFAAMHAIEADSSRWFGEGKPINADSSGMRKALQAWAKTAFPQGTTFHKADKGWSVQVTPRGITKTLFHGNDELLARSVPFISQMIESGMYVAWGHAVQVHFRGLQDGGRVHAGRPGRASVHIHGHALHPLHAPVFTHCRHEGLCRTHPVNRTCCRADGTVISGEAAAREFAVAPAKVPSWISLSSWRMAFLVSPITMRGPAVQSMYPAVLEMEQRMRARPASTRTSESHVMRAERPPHRTHRSPKRSVPVSSRKVVSMTPERVPSIPLRQDVAHALPEASWQTANEVRHIAAPGEDAARQVAGIPGDDHDDVHILRGDGLLEVDVAAVGEHQGVAGLQQSKRTSVAAVDGLCRPRARISVPVTGGASNGFRRARDAA